nr:MAG TPA: hypothetical protein [Caudoviricetes sp.]
MVVQLLTCHLRREYIIRNNSMQHEMQHEIEKPLKNQGF